MTGLSQLPLRRIIANAPQRKRTIKILLTVTVSSQSKRKSRGVSVMAAADAFFQERRQLLNLRRRTRMQLFFLRKNQVFLTAM